VFDIHPLNEHYDGRAGWNSQAGSARPTYCSTFSSSSRLILSRLDICS
jgi:hypothetical protein